MLTAMGLLDAIRRHPEDLKGVFVGGGRPLKPEDLMDLFKVVHSVPGSNRRRQENSTVAFWRDWLVEVGGMLS